MHRYEADILNLLKSIKHAKVEELVKELGISKDAAIWALESLQEKGYVKVYKDNEERAELSDEAKGYAKSLLPEEQLLKKVISNNNIEASSLTSKEDRIGLQWLKTKGFVEIKGGKLQPTESGKRAVSSGIDEATVLKRLLEDPLSYRLLREEKRVALENLIKRKLISIKNNSYIKEVEITESGANATVNKEESINELTRKMIINKEFVGKSFKEYNVNIEVERAEVAKRHPLRSFIEEVKDAYTSMGFTEISGPIIEPSFWVFDSLFVPQDHPAREVQDTFYLSNPGKLKVGDEKLVNEVKKVHEKAWHINWYKEIAEQAVLRSHTTNVSARFIYNLRQNAKNIGDLEMPLKLFSVGRVFRNESIDYKHLAEFYQTDGIVIGEKLTLSKLFDTLLKIYKSLGTEIKFKPSYFPFVEPGVEVDILYNGEWLELGGAGIIRKEISDISKKNIVVLAWGLGVERALMVRDNSIKSISELYGNNIGWLRNKVIV
ncbi:MAG: phenylalanine--tRNA ligase subunit alpha [Candidatus Micrarchaeia archaeon]